MSIALNPKTLQTSQADAEDFASRPAANEPVTVRLVRNQEESQMAVAIRAAVYLGEEGGSYADQFDGNDHCASLLLVFVGDEPAGTLRVRWYAEFARIERLAIRKQFRRLSVLNALIRTALKLAAQKGYKHCTGMVRYDVVPFWKRHGGRITGEAVQTPLGEVLPMMCDLGEKQAGVPPVALADAGRHSFESRIYAWEGRDLHA